MKKNILSFTVIALIASAAIFTGCKKDDTTAPVVTITGGDQLLPLQGSYTELGATAEDDKDGVISATPSGAENINFNLAGTYVITYTATDAAGNVGTATRNVTVYNSLSTTISSAWTGTYTNVSEVDANGPYTYVNNVIVALSATLNNAVTIDRLGDFTNNKVNMVVTASSGTIPTQIVNNVGSGSNSCDVHNRQTSNGVATVNSSTQFSLTYDDAKMSPCSGTRTGVVATFIK